MKAGRVNHWGGKLLPRWLLNWTHLSKTFKSEESQCFCWKLIGQRLQLLNCFTFVTHFLNKHDAWEATCKFLPCWTCYIYQTFIVRLPLFHVLSGLGMTFSWKQAWGQIEASEMIFFIFICISVAIINCDETGLNCQMSKWCQKKVNSNTQCNCTLWALVPWYLSYLTRL